MSAGPGYDFLDYIGLDPDEWPDLWTAVTDAMWEASWDVVNDEAARNPLLSALLAAGGRSLWNWYPVEQADVLEGQRIRVKSLRWGWTVTTAHWRDFYGERRLDGFGSAIESVELWAPVPLDVSALVKA